MHVCTVSTRELKRAQIKVPIKLQGEHHEDLKKKNYSSCIKKNVLI